MANRHGASPILVPSPCPYNEMANLAIIYAARKAIPEMQDWPDQNALYVIFSCTYRNIHASFLNENDFCFLPVTKNETVRPSGFLLYRRSASVAKRWLRLKIISSARSQALQARTAQIDSPFLGTRRIRRCYHATRISGWCRKHLGIFFPPSSLFSLFPLPRASHLLPPYLFPSRTHALPFHQLFCARRRHGQSVPAHRGYKHGWQLDFRHLSSLQRRLE